MLSRCCNAEVFPVEFYYVCGNCHRPADLKSFRETKIDTLSSWMTKYGSVVKSQIKRVIREARR